MVIKQLPSSAFRTPAEYAIQMDLIHQRYDPLMGAGLVGLLERGEVFKVFSSWWFSAALVLLTISIVCCTLDRTPKLWRQSRDIRVVQPDPFFDPRLPDRAAMDGSDRGCAPTASSGRTASACARRPRPTARPTSTAIAIAG